MKKISIILTLLILAINWGHASDNMKKKVAGVVSVDMKQMSLTPAQFVQLARLELVKTDSFEVLDSYDIEYLVKQKDTNLLRNCFSKACLVEIGKLSAADKVMSGSVIRFDDYVMINLKWVDVAGGVVEKEITNKFYYEPDNFPVIISLSVRNLLGMPVDSLIWYNLVYSHPAEAYSSPKVETINLSGPRLGFTFYTGEYAKILKLAESEGGYDASPYMFQFGYQFELRYLNEGKYQALFEFIPMITGFDQGYFIPSVTVMNGLRNNVSGIEIGLGPSFGVITRAKGFYDENHNWHLADHEANASGKYEVVKRLDSRGAPELFACAVISVGKTFRSGKLNIPVNVYCIPSKHGSRFGISFGFNTNRKKA
jgi:hypothetical protein